MSKYSWSDVGQDEQNIASGRLASEVRARIGGATQSLPAMRDAALAELLAGTPEVFNVKSFGARGDGSDDTAALTAWLAAMDTAVTTVSSHVDSGGAKGYMPPGIYGFDGVLEFPAYVNIETAGRNQVVFKRLSGDAKIKLGKIASETGGAGTRVGSIGAFTIDGQDIASNVEPLLIGLLVQCDLDIQVVDVGEGDFYAAVIEGAQNLRATLEIARCRGHGLAIDGGAGGNNIYLRGIRKVAGRHIAFLADRTSAVSVDYTANNNIHGGICEEYYDSTDDGETDGDCVLYCEAGKNNRIYAHNLVGTSEPTSSTVPVATPLLKMRKKSLAHPSELICHNLSLTAGDATECVGIDIQGDGFGSPVLILDGYTRMQNLEVGIIYDNEALIYDMGYMGLQGVTTFSQLASGASTSIFNVLFALRTSGQILEHKDPTHTVLRVRQEGHANPTLTVNGAGRIRWGAGDASVVDSGISRISAAILGTDAGVKFIARGGLGAGNSAAASSLGSVTAKMEVFNAAGVSLGFLPIYDAIT